MLKTKKIINVIIDGLETYEQDAKSFEITAEDLENSYKTVVTVDAVDNNLRKIQKNPITIPVYLDHEFRFTSSVIDINGNKSIPQVINKEITFEISAPSNILFEVKPYTIYATPIVNDDTINCEWYVTDDDSFTPNADTIPQYITGGDSPLSYSGRFTNAYTKYFWVRRTNNNNDVSPWYGKSYNTISTINVTEVNGLTNKIVHLDNSGDFDNGKIGSLDVSADNNEVSRDFGTGTCISNDDYGKVFIYGDPTNNYGGLGIYKVTSVGTKSDISLLTMISKGTGKDLTDWILGFGQFSFTSCPNTYQLLSGTFSYGIRNNGKIEFPDAYFGNATIDTASIDSINANAIMKVGFAIDGSDTSTTRTVTISVTDYGSNAISAHKVVKVWNSATEYNRQVEDTDLNTNISSGTNIESSGYISADYGFNNIITNSSGEIEIEFENTGGSSKDFYIMVEMQNNIYTYEVKLGTVIS